MVHYPSGKTFVVRGFFLRVLIPGCREPHPVMFDREDRPGDLSDAMVLDPRAVVTDSSGRVVYRGPAEIPRLEAPRA
jgi:hypothetical protein